MVKQVKSRRAKAAQTTPEFNARELWLASLGAVSLTRKQGIKLYDTLVDEGRALQAKVGETVAAVNGQVNGTINNVRGRVESILVPVSERAQATYDLVKSEVETRLQPVLARFGIEAPKAKRAPRTAKKATKAKAAKPAKRVVRKTRKAA